MFSSSFLKSIPEGYVEDDVQIVSSLATIAPVVEFNDEEKLVISKFQQASPDPVGPNGRPTIMRIMAWMVHEGANDNLQYFVKEELETAAIGLFEAPNFGVMDFNHSVNRPFSDDPTVIGLWYKASYAFDDRAGKWGILATGMMWSWLFPDQADILLAEQSRRGAINFSMAALPESLELRILPDGRKVQVIHNPIFFTVSALDVPPGDQGCVGVGDENPEITSEQLSQRLLAAALAQPWVKTASQITQGAITMEDNSELISKLTEDRIKAEQAVVELAKAHETELEQAKSSVEVLLRELEDAKTKISELETVRDGLAKDCEDAQASITGLNTQIADLAEFKNSVESDRAASAVKVALAARIAELPDNIRLIHANKDEVTRNRIEDKWMGMSDEQWSTYLRDELLGYSPQLHVSFFDRSKQFGKLPNLATDLDSLDDNDIAARAQKLLKR